MSGQWSFSSLLNPDWSIQISCVLAVCKASSLSSEPWVVSVRAWYAKQIAQSPTPAQLKVCDFAARRSYVALTVTLAYSWTCFASFPTDFRAKDRLLAVDVDAEIWGVLRGSFTLRFKFLSKKHFFWNIKIQHALPFAQSILKWFFSDYSLSYIKVKKSAHW